MANLHYPAIIEKDKKFTALADLSLRTAQLDKTQIISTLVELLDDKFMDLLAEKWSVTGYDGLFLAETDGSKRQLIRSAIQLHQRKGTPWSIREVIRKLGYGEIKIIEGIDGKVIKGLDVNTVPADERWAHYAIVLDRVITNEQATEIRKVLRQFAPARCVLAPLDFRVVALLHNGRAKRRDGVYNRGAA